MAGTLSPRQKNILKFIINFFEKNKFPPTIREIGEQVGISSTSVVNYNLAKLEEMDVITRQRDVSRGLSLNWEALRKLGMGDASGRVRVPVVGTIVAGNPLFTEQLETSEAKEWIELAEGFTGAGEGLFALKVKGDSMVDASVLDGDIVILRKQETANDGDMVAAWISGLDETTLKYFFREGKDVRLQPATPNPAYLPIIRPADQVRINGKVVSVIRVYH